MVAQDSPETAFGIQVPVARRLRRGQHQVHITAHHGAVIDGFIVKDRPSWGFQRVVGAVGVITSLAALAWLMTKQK